MCGIFSLLNHVGTIDHKLIESAFEKGQSRGPEFSIIENISINAVFGFHRLAINGINTNSNQPIKIDNINLIANGEIYNYRELYKMLNIQPETDSDCEVIIHCYKKFGIEYTLQILDGVFAFILIDNTHNTKMYIGRDPYGVRPLYTFDNNRIIGFASTMSMLVPLIDSEKIQHFPPGTYSVYELPNVVLPHWKFLYNNTYSQMTFSTIHSKEWGVEEYKNTFANIRHYLKEAVYKRCTTSDRPIACLLSGGLDSSLITALVSRYFKENGLPPLETYSIGLEGSEDLKYAQQVADFLCTKHTSVIMTKEEFLNAIPEVIYNIESYDTTTVRASIGNYLVAKYISKHSDAKVIFSGEGSDELVGGYLYMTKAPNTVEFDHECKRLLKDIHAFDVTRCDKSISSNGLEPRTPFLDRAFTQYFLSIPANIRELGGLSECFDKYRLCEKYLLRAAFDSTFCDNDVYLPENILWRTKEAFSDGVSSQKESAFEVLQNHINNMNLNYSTYSHNSPESNEQKYYRHIFEEHFPNQGHIIPYFWMPRFVEASDPSARTLRVYTEHHYELCERSL
jgi:asparagine synthase (glutamine-hydrolysing)